MVAMKEKIQKALGSNPFLSGAVKDLMLEIGAELDRLRAEVDALKKPVNPEYFERK
jgi:hypothetical protein